MLVMDTATAGLTKYIHHAQRFGTGSVLETAIGQGVALPLLIVLQKELDKLDRAKLPKSRQKRGGPRLSAEVRVRRACGLPDSPNQEGTDK